MAHYLLNRRSGPFRVHRKAHPTMSDPRNPDTPDDDQPDDEPQPQPEPEPAPQQ
jgi:hypothetical protein